MLSRMILCVSSFVKTMWHGTIGRVTSSSSKLNGITSVSPGCSSNFEKSTVFLRMRGGVPVFNLPVVKPKR